MATLEKIRKRSVLLIVVIAVALLAFIVGDALTNSRNLFGDHTSVAKIGKEKIDINEYQNKREELNNQLEMQRRQNPQMDFDTQRLHMLAIQQLVGEKLIDEALSNLGIQASGDQLRYYMIENPINQNLQTLLQQMNQSGINVQSPAQAYEVIFNPKNNGLTDAQVAPFRNYWIALEKETAQLIRRQTYARLLQGSIRANDLDRKALYNDFVAQAEVEVAYKPYGTLSEKEYPVSDTELKAEYDKVKKRYEIEEETKAISFIAVSVNPSDADQKAAKALANTTIAALRDSAGTLPKEAKQAGVALVRKESRASDLPAGEMKEFLLSAANGEVKMVSENMRGFRAVKMGKRSSVIDSIQVNIVSVAGKDLPAKVLAKLNGGLSVDSITKTFPADSVVLQRGQWVPLMTKDGRTNQLSDAQVDSLVNAGNRFISLMSSADGALYAQLLKQNAPVEVVEYEEISYDLKPGTKTMDDARAKLEKFVSANNTAKLFNANAGKSGYAINRLDLTQSSDAVPMSEGAQVYYPDSRQVVRWVMIDGDAGDVSKIYESNDAQHPQLYVAAVNAVYDDYLPVTHRKVKEELTGKVRRAKAGDAWVKKYSASGKDVASVAKAMGVAPNTVEKLRFGRSAEVPDASVSGMIHGSKKGTFKVVKGDQGVYVFRVNNLVKDGSTKYDAKTYDQQYLQFVSPDMLNMLKGSRKFKSNAYKFEAGD